MTLIIVARMFAFMLFLFLPSIAVLMFAGFVLNSTGYFTWLGLPVLIANGLFVVIKPVRRRIGEYMRRIAGLA